jgi:hypothetical protein
MHLTEDSFKLQIKLDQYRLARQIRKFNKINQQVFNIVEALANSIISTPSNKSLISILKA